MLNKGLKVSTGICQQSVADAVKISNIFLDFRISQGSVAIYGRWGKRILKIGPRHTFLRHSVFYMKNNGLPFSV